MFMRVHRCRSARRSWPRRLALFLAFGVLTADQAAPSGEPVADERRVTAVDLVVELTPKGKPAKTAVPSGDLAPGDFTVLRDGQPVPLVALERGTDPDADPWHIVVLFDRVLASSYTIRWAAQALAEQADELRRLGEVEIVVLDPTARRALAPSRDVDLIDRTLSGIFLAPSRGNELISEREDFLVRRGAGSQDSRPGRAAARSIRTESRRIGAQLDEALDSLLGAQPKTPRRLALLVTDGFDLEPARFYASRVELAEDSLGDTGLRDAATELAATLAAYGWIVAPIAPPPPPQGVGRFGVQLVANPSGPFLILFKLRTFETWLDKNRNKKRAAALDELGLSLREAGELEEAADAFRKAIYHYYNYPKTAERQAVALVHLAETLDMQGKTAQARETARAAVAFDPGLASRFPFVEASFVAPREPLELLQAATAGRMISSLDSLEELFASLDHRPRLTYQVSGPPDGVLHEIAVQLSREAYDVRCPAYARSGTPPATAELRLRRLLDGMLETGDLALAASFEPGRGELWVALEPLELPSSAERSVRISWASRSARGETRYGHETFEPAEDAMAQGLERTLSARVPDSHVLLAVLVEDLTLATWGGATLEIERDRP